MRVEILIIELKREELAALRGKQAHESQIRATGPAGGGAVAVVDDEGVGNLSLVVDVELVTETAVEIVIDAIDAQVGFKKRQSFAGAEVAGEDGRASGVLKRAGPVEFF